MCSHTTRAQQAPITIVALPSIKLSIGKCHLEVKAKEWPLTPIMSKEFAPFLKLWLLGTTHTSNLHHQNDPKVLGTKLMENTNSLLKTISHHLYPQFPKWNISTNKIMKPSRWSILMNMVITNHPKLKLV